MPNHQISKKQASHLACFWNDLPCELQSLSLSFLTAKELFDKIRLVQKDGQRWHGDYSWQQRVFAALFSRHDEEAVNYQLKWLNSALKNQKEERVVALTKWVLSNFRGTLKANARRSIDLQLAYLGTKISLGKSAGPRELQFAEACLRDPNYHSYAVSCLSDILPNPVLTNAYEIVQQNMLMNAIQINNFMDVEMFNEVINSGGNHDMAMKFMVAHDWKKAFDLAQSYINQRQNLQIMAHVIKRIIKTKDHSGYTDEAIDGYSRLTRDSDPRIQFVGWYGLIHLKSLDIQAEISLIKKMKVSFDNQAHPLWVRETACKALTQLIPRVRQWAEATLTNDTGVSARLLNIAYEAAHVTRQALNSLCQTVISNDLEEIRMTSCEQLRWAAPAGDHKVIDVLQQATSDNSDEVRMSACKSLGLIARINDEETIRKLFTCAESDQEIPQARHAAYSSLGCLIRPQDTQGINALHRTAKQTQNENIYNGALSALVQIGGRQAGRAVMQLNKDGYPVSHDQRNSAYRELLKSYNSSGDDDLLRQIRSYSEDMPYYQPNSHIDWNKLQYKDNNQQYDVMYTGLGLIVDTGEITASISFESSEDQQRPQCCNIL